jgi:hypothetical protein
MERCVFRLRLVLAAAILFPLICTAAGAAAQGDERCFPETGQCINGRFREYWEQKGVMPIIEDSYTITTKAVT